MGKESVTAVIDDREPQEELVTGFSAHSEVEDWRIERLDIGDIQFERSSVIIERKDTRTGDYCNSLTSGHLKDQADRLSDATENGFIIIQGDLYEVGDPHIGRSGIGVEANSIRGSMASIMIRDRVPVVPVSSLTDLIDLSVRLARKDIEEPGQRRINTGPLGGSEPVAKRFFALIPSVGPSLAERLYDEYETVEEALSAEPEDLMEINGIGKEKAWRIYDALR